MNYLELIHIANSALHHRLTSLAPLQSFDRASSKPEAEGDISEESFPTTAAQLVLPSNSARTEETSESLKLGSSDSAEDTAGLHNKERCPEEGLEDGSAKTLHQLSQQRLLDLADQTLAALNAPTGESDSKADSNGKQTPEACTSVDAREQTGFSKPSAVQLALTDGVTAQQQDGGIEDVKYVNRHSEDQAVSILYESPDNTAASSLVQPQTVGKAGISNSRGNLGAQGIACFLPKTTNLAQLSAAVAEGSLCEVERNILNGRLKSVTVYHGPCASQV